LGALLYLADVGLHTRVCTISSVSGGSLASGFLATRTKPFHQQDSQEVEDTIKTLARRISGRPRLFWPTVCVVLGLFGLWFLHLIDVVSLGLSFWEVQLVALLLLAAVAIAGAALCGGTLWGWWGTWMYLGVTLAALVSGVVIWWSDANLVIAVTVSILAVTMPSLRCRIAEFAFGATIFKDGSGRLRLAQLPDNPRYVFNATEMHTGRHALLTHDLIYIPVVGLGVPRDLTVKAAVQMSANFPGGFPYRRLRWPWKYQFYFNEYPFPRPVPLLLSDGGIYDNMATSWFQEAPQIAAILRKRLTFLGKHVGDAPVNRLTKQIDGMKDVIDYLIVVNASEPYTWKHTPASALLLWGEVRMLIRITDSMYNQLGVAQKRTLRRQFFRQPGRGVLVSIGEASQLVQLLLTVESRARDRFLSELDVTEQEVEALQSKAQRVKIQLDAAEDDRAARESAAVGTTLRPLSRTTTAVLMQHGYRSMMVNCHLFLDFPLVAELPKFSDFERLADGMRRERAKLQ
jgi:hypothetical protein